MKLVLLYAPEVRRISYDADLKSLLLIIITAHVTLYSSCILMQILLLFNLCVYLVLE
jgi:hypothetical protein